MPSNVKHPGRHFLPASASESSLKHVALEGSIASSGSKRLLNAEEVPPNADMVVPINFGIKYKPTLLGLEYHIVGQPQPQLVYEMLLDVYIQLIQKNSKN